MQEVLPQPLEAIQADLDCYVQEAAQEGEFWHLLSSYEL